MEKRQPDLPIKVAAMRQMLLKCFTAVCQMEYQHVPNSDFDLEQLQTTTIQE